MKKITSFLLMMVLCCTGAFAQAATEYANMVIKIGAPQTEMVPGQWYFLHTPRNPNASVTSADYADSNDGVIQPKGGLVYDNTTGVMISATSVIGELTDIFGVNANNYMKYMVRFVEVEGEEGAYNIQFGNGKWMADAPGKATCTNNQYIAGEAGKYNFYLPALDGVPNSLGRFAWNKFNMAERVDNNGAGNNVAFWANGEVTQESEGYTEESGIAGNKIWEIFGIEVLGEVDLYVESYTALLNYHVERENEGDGTFVQDLRDNNNGIVGKDRGDFREDDVNAFLEYFDKIADLVLTVDTWEGDDPYEEYLKPLYPETADLDTLLADYKKVYNHMKENTIPLALTDIAPGYYTISNARPFHTNKQDTIFYTEEEAAELNAENGLFPGDEGYITPGSVKDVSTTQVPAPLKSIFAENSLTSDGLEGRWMAWGSRQKNARFLWKIETVEGKPGEYRLTNMYKGESFQGVGQGTVSAYLSVNDTTTACFDWRSDKQPVSYTNDNGEVVEDTVMVFNIRGSQHEENGPNYVHPNNHGNGAGTQNWIIGYYDELPSRWFLNPVTEEEANDWMFGPEAQLREKILKGDSIAAAFPAQLEIAKDMVTTVATEASQFSSPYTTNDQQNIPQGKTVYNFLMDGNTSTYWHSRWEDGNVEALVHYLQVEAAEPLDGDYYVKMTRRPVANDHVTMLEVKAYTENNAELTYDEGETVATLDFPYDANDSKYNNQATLISDTFTVSGYSVLRFYPVEIAPNMRGYWHASEFNVYLTEPYKRFENSQYEVRKAEADALAAAVAAWNEAGFPADSVELLEDETFLSAYNTLVAAYETWSKVYVDPAALREAIDAAPAENLFVTGNNPGQWKEGVATPAATVAAAEAYNAAGAYTPAESEAHIAAIAKAEADVWAAANKVETGKWYRFSFPTEEAYEGFEWDKTGAKAVEHEVAGVEQSPALFGKTVAIGQSFIDYVGFTNEEGENDTVNVYTVEEKDAFYAGDKLYFFEDADFSEGEDLFRFIQATDSTYMIQNKATGLFIHGGYPPYLSAVPSYFNVKAIGAGANLIGALTIFGGDEEGYNYLHGQRSTNTLTTWDSENLGSNSMIMIEEVEAVAEEPATEYVQKLWPGKVYTNTYPVDVTVSEGATVYGAELVVTEEDTTIVLKNFEAETIKAGIPFILIADLEGDYITTDECLEQLAKNYENWGWNEKFEANALMDEEYYVEVSMNHGMEVDTVVSTLLDLRGTLKATTVKAGKAILAKENGFEHTLVDKPVSAYGAWIASDFDPETSDVLSGLSIKIEGSIESGINEVLNKVAQSGNIYNAAGQLVGKGNINTINKLPAGIYVVNGVKVTKK